MITTIETGSPRLLGLKLSGKLHDEDYRQFLPGGEGITTEEGKRRRLIQFEDFHGWDLHSAWDDLDFGMAHVERIAIVGDRRWEMLLANFAKPFSQAEMKYFDRSEIDAAWEWLRETGEEGTEGFGDLAEVSNDPDIWSHVPWY